MLVLILMVVSVLTLVLFHMIMDVSAVKELLHLCNFARLVEANQVNELQVVWFT